MPAVGLSRRFRAGKISSQMPGAIGGSVTRARKGVAETQYPRHLAGHESSARLDAHGSSVQVSVKRRLSVPTIDAAGTENIIYSEFSDMHEKDHLSR